jgi:hypothetical protein
MKEIKLTKMRWGRRRFVVSPLQGPIENWFDEYIQLEEKIRKNSAFQRIGQKALIEVDSTTKKGSILVEVVGTPTSGDIYFDLEPQDVFIHELDSSSFLMSFEEIAGIVQIIRGNKGLIGLGLSNYYHIVNDEEKLALHFFRQKDYIHSEH